MIIEQATIMNSRRGMGGKSARTVKNTNVGRIRAGVVISGASEFLDGEPDELAVMPVE